MLYINITRLHPSLSILHSIPKGRLATHGSYQILRTKEEEEENMNCVCSWLQLCSRFVIFSKFPSWFTLLIQGVYILHDGLAQAT